MTTTERTLLDALADLPAQHRTWLSLDPEQDRRAFELWCFYGWGVVVNDAQLQLADDVFRAWPGGTIHVERWANRSGKTVGDILIQMFAIWRKWRYQNASFDDWLAYSYKTLQSAPENRLMGKAWQTADSLIRGVGDPQKSPFTNRQRNGVLRGFFEAGKSQAMDGSDELWVRCRNNGKIDFLSTHDGAGRMESDSWWLLIWDEWVRQKPVSAIPLLIDQTFLPRSADYLAPIVLTSTITEEAEPIIGEIEDMAEENRRAGHKDWNFVTYGREVNFSQTRDSIERQLRVSLDKEAAGRSVHGLSGQAGYGLFPDFILSNAFTDGLPERLPPDKVPEGYALFAAFYDASTGDENVLTTFAVPWPPQQANLLLTPITGVEEAVLRSSRSLTPEEQVRFAIEHVRVYEPRVLWIDSTAEGGQLVYKMLRAATYVDAEGRTKRVPGSSATSPPASSARRRATRRSPSSGSRR